MRIVANVLCGLVAIAYLGFLVLEMFLWDPPIGRRVFSMTPGVFRAVTARTTVQLTQPLPAMLARVAVVVADWRGLDAESSTSRSDKTGTKTFGADPGESR